MARVSIGIPTYNDHERVGNLLASIFMFTDFPEGYDIVVLDDGTPDKEMVEKLQDTCDSFGVPLIRNEKNMGIPYSWNRLTEYYDDAELQVLFNDDVGICSDAWLRNAVYVFDNNDRNYLGSVGWNLIQIDLKTGGADKNYSMPNYDASIGRCGAPCGCSFMFLREHWKKIININGSVGFPEDVITAFYEETWFGFSQWKKGWASYTIPFPAVEHRGSQTFSNNSILSFTEFNEYMPKDKYLSILRQHPEKMALPISEHEKLAEKGLCFRMDYSRVIFAHVMGAKDSWQCPQEEVHKRLVDVTPKRLIKYIDRNGNFKECLA